MLKFESIASFIAVAEDARSVAQERPSQLPDGRLAFRLKRPFAGADEAVILKPSGIND